MSQSHSDSRLFFARAAVTLLAVLAGCAPHPRQGRNAGAARNDGATQRGARTSPAPASLARAEDACAGRLHDICGLLLEYYALNRQFPERLEDLAPLAEAESEFVPACPVSGLEYVYVPGGLGAAGTGQRLIIYEQTPAHNGLRWVVVGAPAEGDLPPSTRVIPFSEERFRKYFGTGGAPAPQ